MCWKWKPLHGLEWNGWSNLLKKTFLFLVMLTLIIVFNPLLVPGLEIVGDSAVEDRPNFRLTVTPHTFSSPTGPFTQTYSLWNKTDLNFSNNVFGSYVFNDALESFRIEVWQPPVFDWVALAASCPIGADSGFELNAFEGGRNPHYGECWEQINCTQELFQNGECSNVGSDFNSFFFQRQFHSFSNPLREIYFDNFELIFGNKWVDRTSVFEEIQDSNQFNYYNTVPASFDANQERTWRITYRPILSQPSRKWDLTMYSDENASCLFDGNGGNCGITVHLDPWFDTDFLCKYRVDLNTSIISSDLNSLPILYNFDPSAREIAGCSFNADGSDFRPVSSDEATGLNYYFEGLWTGTDVNAWILLDDFNGTLNDDNFFVYFGNATAIDANDSTSVYATTNFAASYDLDQNTGLYRDRTSNSHNSITANVASRDTNAFIGRNAPDFNADTAYIEVNYSDDFNLNVDFAISLWMFPLSGQDPGGLVSFVNPGNLGNEAFRFITTGGTFNRIGAGIENTVDEVNSITSPLNVFDLNEWSQVVFDVNSTHISLYFNGVSNAVVDRTVDASATSIYRLFIGARTRQVGQHNTFDGIIDELSIWNRALSADEITLQYRNQVKDGFILSTGATEINNVAPDVNVLYPQNSETFDKDLNSFIDVNVSIQDTDNNSTDILIDLNFSTSQTQGTGTVIVNDSNLSTAWTCDGDDLSTAQECKFNWDISAVANDDYFILVEVSDGTSTDFNSGANTFTITSAVVGDPNTNPVLDINAIDGNPDNLALPVFRAFTDGNLTIDFNAFDFDNNRLTIDLNFSTSQTQGTGTIIAIDINLDSTICADVNFTQPAGVACSWDFNIDQSLVADDNYFILGLLNDGSDTNNTDFNATENSFAVDNITTIDDLVAAPQTNSPLNSADGNVFLTWTDLPNDTNYTIYRSDDGVDYNNVSTIVQDSSFFEDSGINDNQLFFYIVQANGPDTNSNVATAFTFDRTAPTSGVLTVTENLSLDFIDLNWTAASDNNSSAAVIDYNLFRSSDNIDFNTLVSLFDGTLTHQDTTATDSNAPITPADPTVTAISTSQIDVNWLQVFDRNSIYYYRVQALDEERNDSNSNTDVNTVTSGIQSFFVDCQTGGTCTVGDGGEFDDFNQFSALGLRISGLAASTEYCFRIKAVDGADNNSTLSGQVCATTQAGEVANNFPVLDINAIDGNPDNLALPVFRWQNDGNLTIDFEAFDLDNNRLTIDLNFSTSQTQGTGTIIATDINLDSTICNDVNFSIAGVQCSFDLNIHQDLVADNNYFILGLLNDGSDVNNLDFNATENSFAVDNITTIADLVAVPQTNQALNSGDGNILLTWTDLPNETSYTLFRSDDGTDFNTVATIAQDTATFTDQPLNDNQLFHYIIQGNIMDTNSNTATAFTFDRTAPVSGVLTVTENFSLNYLDVNWTAATDNNSVAGVIDYNVFRSDDNVSFTALVSLFDGTLTHPDTTATDLNSPITPAAPTVTTISATQLDVNWLQVFDRNSIYYYRVQALDEERNDSNTSVDVNTVTTGIKQFGIDCQTGGTCTVGDGGDFDDVNTNSALGFRVSGLASNTEYCFRIKAIDDVDNNSALSGQTCGTTEDVALGNTAPVLDINAIDGNPDNLALPVFSSAADGNLTIDFNAFDFDNNRLTIDLNFSTSQTQGTGTIMITDLNLDSTICADVNFSSPAGVNCSFDLNIDTTLVADNNYFILGVLDDNSGGTDFNATENSFAVDNVVDVVRPINLFINDDLRFNQIFIFNPVVFDTNVLTPTYWHLSPSGPVIGLTQTILVRNAAGDGSCAIDVNGGIITTTTC